MMRPKRCIGKLDLIQVAPSLCQRSWSKNASSSGPLGELRVENPASRSVLPSLSQRLAHNSPIPMYIMQQKHPKVSNYSGLYPTICHHADQTPCTTPETRQDKKKQKLPSKHRLSAIASAKCRPWPRILMFEDFVHDHPDIPGPLVIVSHRYQARPAAKLPILRCPRRFLFSKTRELG